MPTSGYAPQQVKQFFGLNTLMDPTNLPFGVSPDCQDVEFLPGLVRSRPGTTAAFSQLGGGTVTVNYLKTYINTQLNLRLLALTPGIASLSSAGGVLYKENPQGTLNIVSQSISANYCNSCSSFTREYLAFGDGQFGTDLPYHFNDTNLDRVSQEGPAVAPGASDESLSWAIAAGTSGAIPQSFSIPANGLSQSGYVVTVVLLPSNTGIAFSKVGDPIQITGAGVAGYNGTWTISAILNGTAIQFVASTQGLAVSGGGLCNFGLVQYVPASGSVPSSYSDGQIIDVTGVGVAGYNSNGQIIRGNIFGGTPGTNGLYPSGSPSIYVFVGSAVFGLAASGGGTVTNAGNVVAGVHKVSVVFETRSGYLTRPAPPTSYTSAGGKRVVVSNIPVGPPNVVARIVIFTASGGDNFFYTTGQGGILSTSMVIADNSTTTATFDFSDATLLAGTNADSLFDLVVLGECSGVLSYFSRLFWWGERNRLQNILNMDFDGGFTNPGSTPNFPFGWVQDTTSSAGGASANASGYPVVFGDAYAIVGNGATVTRGKIAQTLYRDYLGNPVLSPNTAYSIRARIAKNSTLAAGTLHINAHSATGGFTTTGISVTPSQLATWYQEFTATLLTAQTTIPSDLVLQIYADSTPTNNGAFLIDCLEIYPSSSPDVDPSVVRSSGSEDPESFDGVAGFLQVAQGDGTRVTSGFVLRNILYFSKERSLYATADDGQNEPSAWTIQQISAKVGTPSVRGVGLGDEWAVIASQEGLYFFDGGTLGEENKLSKEIQPTWDSINWTYGHLINVTVDTKRKRIYVAAPFGAATTPNKILTMDYVEGFGEGQRKWAPWAISVNSMALVLRDDGTQQLFLGNGAGTGAIYQLDTTYTVHSDDGAAINSYWQSGYAQDSVRLNFGYVVANIVGAGSCNLTLFRGDQTNKTVIRSWTLSQNGFTNMERQIQKQGYRMAVKFGTDAAGDFFSLQGFSLYITPSRFAQVRGINA